MAKNFEIIFNIDSPMMTLDNNKKLWCLEDILIILNNHNCRYLLSPHIPDEMSSFNHYHCGIHTDSDNTYETIAKWFNLPTNSVQKINGRFDSTYALYIIHYNQPNKTAVSPDKVISNFNLDYDKLINNIKGANRLEEILDGINSGVIKQYNYNQYISNSEFVKWNRQIKLAFEYRVDLMRGVDRQMQCIFIDGDSGTGKTTYAKQICNDRKLSFYVSSGSNDVLDDYKGEEAIILDDLRPSCLSLSDLLKMLDNNTASSVKSRFKNKVLECKLIIITTTLKIDEFFNQVFENENETKIQLMRRCQMYITMTPEKMIIRMFDNKKRSYDTLSVIDNLVLSQFMNFDDMSEDEKLNKACSILGATAELMNGLKKGLENKSFIPDDNITF